MEDERDTSSLRQRIKKSSMSLSCCFNAHHHRFEGLESTSPDEKPMSPMRSPSAWLRSPEIRGRCRGLMSRMGHRRRHSADFSYDPLSYALNFEDEDGGADDFPARNFTSRLPISPPPPPPPPQRDVPAMRSASPTPTRAMRIGDQTMPIARSVSPVKSRAANGRIVTPATATVVSRRGIVAFS